MKDNLIIILSVLCVFLLGTTIFSTMMWKDCYNYINELENNFVPTAIYERFGLYNRINRLCGYTPKQKSGEIATKQSENTWNKIKTEVIEKTKKFRM